MELSKIMESEAYFDESMEMEADSELGTTHRSTDESLNEIELHQPVPHPRKQGNLRKVGNIHCFWHRENGVPRITIGPNWGISFILWAVAGFFVFINISIFTEILAT